MAWSSSIVTTLLVGVPSATFAGASYFLASRARHEAQFAGSKKIDADAYERARTLYEASITELRKGQDDLRTEIRRLNDQLDQARDRIRGLQHDLREARSRIWDLEHPGPGRPPALR